MRDRGPSTITDPAPREEHTTAEEVDPETVPPRDLDERVDVVISDHAVVVAELEARARREARWAGFSEPVGQKEPPRVARRPWDASEVHLEEDVLRDRQLRERVLREFEPGVVRPAVDPPLVTRAGIFYVAPDYAQVRGLDARSDVALLRAGIRSVSAFMRASDREVANLTGLAMTAVSAAKDDLDLTRLEGVDSKAADLLRLAGVHSISSLAKRDPSVLHGEVRRLHARHRFFDLPEGLASADSVAALIEDAQGHA